MSTPRYREILADIRRRARERRQSMTPPAKPAPRTVVNTDRTSDAEVRNPAPDYLETTPPYTGTGSGRALETESET